jgi:hypothetical protein
MLLVNIPVVLPEVEAARVSVSAPDTLAVPAEPLADAGIVGEENVEIEPPPSDAVALLLDSEEAELASESEAAALTEKRAVGDTLPLAREVKNAVAEAWEESVALALVKALGEAGAVAVLQDDPNLEELNTEDRVARAVEGAVEEWRAEAVPAVVVCAEGVVAEESEGGSVPATLSVAVGVDR